MNFLVIDTIIFAYTISTSLFLIVRLFNESARKRTNSYLNKANLIIAVVLIFNAVFIIENSINCYALSRKQISDQAIITTTTACSSTILQTFILAFIFQTPFFFKRNRSKISFTIISVVLLAIFSNFERVLVVIKSFFRDYLPSSWTVYYDYKNWVWIFFFSIIYFSICWISIDRPKIGMKTKNKPKPT